MEFYNTIERTTDYNCVCPVCKHKHTKTLTEKIKYDKFLDGKLKMSLQEELDMFLICPECNFLYPIKNQNVIIREETMNIFKELIKSEEYLNELKNENEVLKKLNILTQIRSLKTEYFVDSNSLWLKYYEEIGDEDNQQKYLLKRIEDINNRIVCSDNAFRDELCFPTTGVVVISVNEVLTDLYRRSKQTDKAQKYINYALNDFRFESEKANRRMYYLYQQKLLDENNTSHV